MLAVWFSFFPLLIRSFCGSRLLIRSSRGPSVLRFTGSLYVGFLVALRYRAQFSVFYSWELGVTAFVAWLGTYFSCAFRYWSY